MIFHIILSIHPSIVSISNSFASVCRRMHAVISSIATNIRCDVDLDIEFEPQTWGFPAVRHDTNSGAQRKGGRVGFSRRKAHPSQPRQQQVALSRFEHKQRLVPFWVTYGGFTEYIWDVAWNVAIFRTKMSRISNCVRTGSAL